MSPPHSKKGERPEGANALFVELGRGAIPPCTPFPAALPVRRKPAPTGAESHPAYEIQTWRNVRRAKKQAEPRKPITAANNGNGKKACEHESRPTNTRRLKTAPGKPD